MHEFQHLQQLLYYGLDLKFRELVRHIEQPREIVGYVFQHQEQVPLVRLPELVQVAEPLLLLLLAEGRRFCALGGEIPLLRGTIIDVVCVGQRQGRCVASIVVVPRRRLLLALLVLPLVLPVQVLRALRAHDLVHLHQIPVLKFLEDFDLPYDRGGYSPVPRMLQADLLQRDHLPARGMGQRGGEALRAVDLAVRALADLLEAAVVRDGAGGESVPVDGIVADRGRSRPEVEGGVVGRVVIVPASDEDLGQECVDRDGILAGR
mmetsp:Transcript_7472/g.18534  ORF Transcript_7472/g.18534 Transcript_7472/m.18534 type:complete len:263 (+) Transcript_7472:562-1350(+)